MATDAAAPSPLEDAVLVRQVQEGDMVAFSRLVTKYQNRVLNLCWRLCGNLDDAQDLTQEAFLNALEKIQTYRHQAGFYTWLFRIAVNEALSLRRKAARRVTLSLHDGDGHWRGDHQAARLVNRVSAEPEDPPERLSASEVHKRVLAGLDQLSDDYRAVIVLRDVESFDYQQIAEILEVSVGTVKSRLHRARMAMREHLKPMLSPG